MKTKMNKLKLDSKKQFIVLCIGLLVATIGNGLSSFGIGVYVYQLNHLVSQKALISLLAFMPGLLLTPIAGVFADRYDRRMLMIAGDGLSMIGLIYILIRMFSGNIKFWEIGIGVTISSIFSALTFPAFNATLSDILDENQYTRASGIVNAINSSRFLLSPILAGFLLRVSNIELILILDICTIVVTVITTLIVKQSLVTEQKEYKKSPLEDFKNGWKTLRNNEGVFYLTVVAFLICFFMGVIQELITPLLLLFTDSMVLGTVMTICACGMLVSSIYLGVVPIKKDFQKILAISLFLAGIFMMGLGFRENLVLITLFGFLFFFMIPFANMSIDYLVRTNIKNEYQGRIWSIIGLISQLGYVVCYAVIGPLGDFIFTPLLESGGLLADSIGKIIGTGEGRGLALLIILSGFLMSLVSIFLGKNPKVKSLKQGS